MKILQLSPIIRPEDFFYNIVHLYDATYDEINLNASVQNDYWKGIGELVNIDNKGKAILTDIYYHQTTHYNIPYRFCDSWGQLLFIRADNDFYILSFEILTKSQIIIRNHLEFVYEKEDNRIWLQEANTRMQMLTIYLDNSYLQHEWFWEISHIDESTRSQFQRQFQIPQESELESLLNLVFDILNTQHTSIKIVDVLTTIVQKTLNLYFFPKEPIKQDNESKLKEAKIFLLKDFKNPPSLHLLSKIAGMNRSKFQKSFAELYGHSFYQYFQKHRFEYAKNLIEHKNYTASEAAYAIGYKHLGHFSIEFNKINGVKPSDLKNKNKI
jgi:AraC-like DNA-binding protein